MARDPKFYGELKKLNEEFIKFVDTTIKKSPYFDLSPTLKDYVKQFNEIDDKYKSTPAQNNFLTTTTPTTTTPAAPTIGTLATATTTTTSTTEQPKTLFGSSLPQSTNPASFFSFSLANSQTTNNTSTFSFGASSTLPFQSKPLGEQTAPLPADTTAAAAEGDDGEESTPPQPNVEKYEEPDAKFQVRCKLYERGKMADGTASINLLGFGVLFVKSMDANDKLQVVFRQDPDLRKVSMNEVITPQIPVKHISKTVQMLIPGTNGETKFYFVKVKEESDAKKLFDLLKFV